MLCDWLHVSPSCNSGINHCRSDDKRPAFMGLPSHRRMPISPLVNATQPG